MAMTSAATICGYVLILNARELDAAVYEQVTWQLAVGDLEREAFTEWIPTHRAEPALDRLVASPAIGRFHS
jgi:hypothetical protein